MKTTTDIISPPKKAASPLQWKVNDQLTVRELLESDAPDLYALIDRNRAHLRPWLPWVDGTRTPDDTLAFIRLSQERHANNLGFNGCMVYDGSIAGAIGFHPIDWINKTVELGYWVSEDRQGLGLVSGACKTMVDYAFSMYQLHRVQIRCAVQNARSCALIERLGFRFEGVTREGEFVNDHYLDLNVYAVLNHEWHQRHHRPPHERRPV